MPREYFTCLSLQSVVIRNHVLINEIWKRYYTRYHYNMGGIGAQSTTPYVWFVLVDIH